MVGVREVSTKGVGWESEVSDLVVTPLNLVLYMHLRIFAYTSNTFIASLEYTNLDHTTIHMKPSHRDDWVLITTCKQLVWSNRIGRNMHI